MKTKKDIYEVCDFVHKVYPHAALMKAGFGYVIDDHILGCNQISSWLFTKKGVWSSAAKKIIKRTT